MAHPSSDRGPRLSRRDWLRLSAVGAVGASMSGWLETLAADTADNPQRKRSCILLWMNGGPSQMDTFDLKPGHANGGPFRAIDTSAPGLRISEYLPTVAKYGHRMAVIRGMSTKEADHGRATFVMRTGYNPTGPIQYPGIGSLLSKELGADDAPLPNCVAIAPYRFFNPAAYGPGFLGPQYAPLIVGDNVQFRQPGQPRPEGRRGLRQAAPRAGRGRAGRRGRRPRRRPARPAAARWKATSSAGIPASRRAATRPPTTGRCG